jgi:hypothetical protein
MIKEFITTTKIETKPAGIVLHGKGGMGKTTFLAKAIKDSKKGILFECGESGLTDLTDKNILDVPRYSEVLGMGSTSEELSEGWIKFKEDIIKGLMTLPHGFTHIAFDNFDNLINNNLNSFVIKNYYENKINKANAYGGQKLREMDSELTLIIKAFEYLQAKGISILLSTHSQTINFKDPAGDDYKKWSLNLPAMEGANLRDRIVYWSSMTMFATIDVEVENKKVEGSRRVLKTQFHPAYEAKSRYNIPETIDFSYENFKNEIMKVRN